MIAIKKESNGSSLLSIIPGDAILHIWAYFSAFELTLIQSTCHQFFYLSSSQPIWRDLCRSCGKVGDDFSKPTHEMVPSIDFKSLYYRIPCIGIDFSSIGAAIKACHQARKLGQEHKRELAQDKINQHAQQQAGAVSHDYQYDADLAHHLLPISHYQITIVVMPGTYRESIEMNRASIVPLYNGASVTVNIKAAFPQKGNVILIQDDPASSNTPCINLIIERDDRDQTYAREYLGGGVCLHLEDLHLEHYSLGNNIWRGQSCARVDGVGLKLSLKNCCVTSYSGRGVVATLGSMVYLSNCTVHDCAGTGVYTADPQTYAVVENCNVIRCGIGTRLPLHLEQQQPSIISPSAQLLSSPSPLSEQGRGQGQVAHQQETVPKGHSGMFIENSLAVITNCLVAGNTLTGLSVVRGGWVKLDHCHILDNGSDALSIQDVHDVRLGFGEDDQFLIRGGVRDGGDNELEGRVDDPEKLKRARSYLRPSPFSLDITERIY